MARKKRVARQSKKVFLFIVEGCTEKNYLGLLKLLYRRGASIENCGGGGARSVLRQAKKLIRRHRDYYSGYVILFDRDTYNPAKDRNLRDSLESRENVEIYISQPCFENWLIAHFQAKLADTVSCNACAEELKKYIPNYSKNDCPLLNKYIDEVKIEIAMENYPHMGEVPQKYFVQR